MHTLTQCWRQRHTRASQPRGVSRASFHARRHPLKRTLGTESPLDVALFERVEVIRGPSSSVYGTSAFFGVVNLVTRPGGSLNGVEAEAQLGSETTRSGRVTVGGRTAGGVEGLASATGFGADGNRRLYYPEFDNGDA